jgi:hypothetical protein
MINTKDPATQNRLISLLLIGVVMLGYSIYMLPTIWTSKDSLMPVSGVLDRADTYYSTVTDRHGDKSRKAELVFYLVGIKKKFALVENIGNEYSLKEYEQIKDGLNRSDSVTVWIKEEEDSYWDPKVFQITTDRKILLEFDAVRYKEQPVALFLCLGSLGCIGFSVYAFFPKLFRRKQ